jgi:hypothetical protein
MVLDELDRRRIEEPGNFLQSLRGGLICPIGVFH